MERRGGAGVTAPVHRSLGTVTAAHGGMEDGGGAAWRCWGDCPRASEPGDSHRRSRRDWKPALERRGGSVTNGNEVWRSDAAEEALDEWDAVRNLKSQELVKKLQETLQHSTPVLDMQGSIASLSLPVSSGKVNFELLKLPVSEARAHVQQVLFSLADQIWSLEKQLKVAETSIASSCSPVKQSQQNHVLLIPDVDARKKSSAGSTTHVKKRMPGESLINPGCKSKKMATGVDFEES